MDGTAHTGVPFDADTAPTWTSEMDVAIRTVRFRFDFKTGHSITVAISRGLWRLSRNGNDSGSPLLPRTSVVRADLTASDP